MNSPSPSRKESIFEAVNRKKSTVLQALQPRRSSIRQSISVVSEHFLSRKGDNELYFDSSSQNRSQHPYVLHPNGLFRRIWDTITAVFVLYLCFQIPMQAAFRIKDIDWGLVEFHFFLDLWFCCDLCLNFRTGYIHYGAVIMEPKRIFKNYVKSWFITDFIGSVPWEIFVDGGVSFAVGAQTVKSMRYLKLSNLLRLNRVVKYFRSYMHIYHISLTCFLILVSVHSSSCIWIWAVNPCTGERFETHCGQYTILELYLQGVYIAISMMFGASSFHLLGPDSALVPWRNGEKSTSWHIVSSIVISANGLIAFSSLVASFTVAFRGAHTLGQDFHKKLEDVKNEMAYFDLPFDIQNQVKNECDAQQRQATEKIGLLNDRSMSSSLRKKIALFLYKDLIQSVPFFSTIPGTLLAKICLNINTQVFLAREPIIQRGEIGTELFILSRGRAVIVAEENQTKPVYISDGAFFGEYAVLMETRIVSSVYAIKICKCCVLTKKIFDSLLGEHPEFASKIKDLVLGRTMEAYEGQGANKPTRQDMLRRMGRSIDKKIQLRTAEYGKIVPIDEPLLPQQASNDDGVHLVNTTEGDDATTREPNDARLKRMEEKLSELIKQLDDVQSGTFKGRHPSVAWGGRAADDEEEKEEEEEEEGVVNPVGTKKIKLPPDVHHETQ